MAWLYNQASGKLFKDGKEIGCGYSGFGACKNKPEAQSQVNEGPIPLGTYEISPEFNSDQHGPVCFHLTPEEGTDTFGRGGFLIHGDSGAHPGLASHGCIVLPRPVRMLISCSEDRLLQVV